MATYKFFNNAELEALRDVLSVELHKQSDTNQRVNLRYELRRISNELRARRAA